MNLNFYVVTLVLYLILWIFGKLGVFTKKQCKNSSLRSKRVKYHLGPPLSFHSYSLCKHEMALMTCSIVSSKIRSQLWLKNKLHFKGKQKFCRCESFIFDSYGYIGFWCELFTFDSYGYIGFWCELTTLNLAGKMSYCFFHFSH